QRPVQRRGRPAPGPHRRRLDSSLLSSRAWGRLAARSSLPAAAGRQEAASLSLVRQRPARRPHLLRPSLPTRPVLSPAPFVWKRLRATLTSRSGRISWSSDQEARRSALLSRSRRRDPSSPPRAAARSGSSRHEPLLKLATLT